MLLLLSLNAITLKLANSLRSCIVAAYAHGPDFSDAAHTADTTLVRGCWTKRMTAKMTDRSHQVVVVPNDLALRHYYIIATHHAAPTAGHPGATHTLELIQRCY